MSATTSAVTSETRLRGAVLSSQIPVTSSFSDVCVHEVSPPTPCEPVCVQLVSEWSANKEQLKRCTAADWWPAPPGWRDATRSPMSPGRTFALLVRARYKEHPFSGIGLEFRANGRADCGNPDHPLC
jgi:hypothetical protein